MNYHEIYFQVKEHNGNVWVDKEELSAILRNCAEETTSPRGVEPIYHVHHDVERDEWQIRKWVAGGNYRIIDTYNDEEEANNAWCDMIYSTDFREGYGYSWQPTIDDAIEDYAERNEMSIEEVKEKIEESEKEYEEICNAATAREARNFRSYVETYRRSGSAPKKLRGLCEDILRGFSYGYGCERTPHTHHSDEFKEEVRNILNEINSKQSKN